MSLSAQTDAVKSAIQNAFAALRTKVDTDVAAAEARALNYTDITVTQGLDEVVTYSPVIVESTAEVNVQKAIEDPPTLTVIVDITNRVRWTYADGAWTSAAITVAENTVTPRRFYRNDTTGRLYVSDDTGEPLEVLLSSHRDSDDHDARYYTRDELDATLDQMVAAAVPPTDLSNTLSANEVLIASSTGGNTTLPRATTVNAGVMAAADKVKLDGIDADADVNMPTTSSRTLADAGTVLQAQAFVDHNASGDHDARYYTQAQLDTSLGAKLDATDVVDVLTSISTTQALSAARGKFLKDEVDNINALLQSDQATLDSLQEIVDFIQLNRADLDSLTIASIAGLQTALNGKVDVVAGKALSENDFTNALLNKLNGIEAGATATSATDLSQSRNATSYTVISSTGTNTTLAAATETAAGVLIGADKAKLNGIDDNANNYVHPGNSFSMAALTGAAVIDDINVDGNGHITSVTTRSLTKGNLGLGNVPNLDMSNASNLATGTVPTSRLPGSALIGDTTYTAGTGLSLSGTTFNINNPFNPAGSYGSLRAQATTKADVGLSLVDNYASADASTGNTLARRNSSGDIIARLFRSEYDVTNDTVGFIMTQVDTATNNYLRPSTPAQVKAAMNIAAADVSGLSDAATTAVSTIRAGTTKANVGLSLVDNLSAASIRAGTTAANVGLGNVPNSNNLSSFVNGPGFVDAAGARAAVQAGNLTQIDGVNGHRFRFDSSTSWIEVTNQSNVRSDMVLGDIYVTALAGGTWLGSLAAADIGALPAGGKAADSNLLDGIDSGGFLRANATDVASGRVTFSNGAGLEVPRGITGGYGDSAGTGSNWGASIWGMGDAYNGSGNGVSHAPGSYEIAWLRAGHASADSANVGEGLHIFSQGAYRGGIGTAGGRMTGDLRVDGVIRSTDYTSTSDIRVKSDIRPLDGALDKILSLTGFTYHMKGLAKTDRRLGLSAQDVLKVFPEAVHGTEETHYSVSYGSLVAGLVEAVKEQNATIQDLLQRVATLESGE